MSCEFETASLFLSKENEVCVTSDCEAVEARSVYKLFFSLPKTRFYYQPTGLFTLPTYLLEHSNHLPT
jgi:hypothetical protein